MRRWTRTLSSHYQRALVERLLPTVWDETYAYGMANPEAPDPDMPKGHVDKKKGSSLFAHLVDIREAWRTTDLTRLERRAVFMVFGLDWSHGYAALHEDVDRSTISHRLDAAVGKITARLNDEDYVDGYDGLAELANDAA